MTVTEVRSKSELKEFLKNAAAEMKTNAVDHQQPPWTAFPEYERYSMGWRKGPGEDYWQAFHSWVRSLESQDLKAFISQYPEPEDWKGFGKRRSHEIVHRERRRPRGAFRASVATKGARG